jgi:hypothetical protein
MCDNWLNLVFFVTVTCTDKDFLVPQVPNVDEDLSNDDCCSDDGLSTDGSSSDEGLSTDDGSSADGDDNSGFDCELAVIRTLQLQVLRS